MIMHFYPFLQRTCLLAGLLVFLTMAAVSAAAQESSMLHGSLQSAAERDYPPFSMVGPDGLADGFSVELLRATLGHMKRDVTFRTGPWPEVRGLLERGEVEALPLVGRTPEREELFDFTFPYMSLHGAIVVRKGTSGINTLADLKGRQVAVMEGDNAEEFLHRQDRGITIVTTSSFEKALTELSQGLHDAVVIQRLVAIRLVQELGLADLHVSKAPIEGFRQDFCFAVREGDSKTLALLNEGLALVMADGTYRRLHAKWFADMQLPADRPIIVGGDSRYPPFEYLDDQGKPAGFTVELTRAIAEEMNMAVQVRLGERTDILAALQNGDIDIIEGIFYSPERDRSFDFSPSHLLAHFVAVTRGESGSPPQSFADLADKSIVVQRGDVVLDILTENGLRDRVNVVATQDEVLHSVSTGESDCALLPRMNSRYLIEKNGWDNLVIGKHSFLAGEYGYGVAQGNVALLAQFTEGLRILQENGEYRRIHEKWLGLYEEKQPDFPAILRYIAMAVLPLLALSALLALWTWSLRRQVARKTREVEESADSFRFIFEAANVGKSLTLPSGKINVNRAFAEMLGYTQVELEDTDWQSITPPEDLPIAEKAIAPLLNGSKDKARFEKRYIHKNGSTIWADVSVVIRRDAQGEPLYFVTNVVDISERKHVEMQMRHLNSVLRTIRHINQLIVRERDRETLIREAGKLLVNNRGYLSVMIILVDAKNQPFFWSLEGLAASNERLAGLLERGTLPGCCILAVKEDEVVLIDDRRGVCVACPTAQECPAKESLCAVLRYDGCTLGYLVVAVEDELAVDKEERDLFGEMAGDLGYALHVIAREEEHAKSEAALQRSESRFRHFAEMAPVGIIISDEKQKTLFASTKFTELFGYTIEDIPSVEQWWPLAYPEEDLRDRVRREWQKVVDTVRRTHSESAPMEYPVTCKDGSVRQVEFRLAVSGGLNLVVLVDISARKRAEKEQKKLQAQLIQAQKMESVGRLAGGVAHDYNNMLSVIMGFTELALSKTTVDDPRRDDLEEVLAAAHRASDITRQLLAFARRQTIAPKVLDLNDTVGNMLKMLRRLIGEDIDLLWRASPGLWAVNIDPSQLDQILANLCVNARDAIADVGKVTIETGNTIFDEKYCKEHNGFIPGEYVLLAVSDNGCGMDGATLDRVFDPFFTTKESGKGTGLGLATVYGIVKQNAGFINVYSELGGGTTFKIYLPRHRSSTDQLQITVEDEMPRGHGETVLVVEDEVSILRLAIKMLRELGYTPLQAQGPQQALELAEKHEGEIDLLLTDVIMPEMNGRQLAEELHKIYPEVRSLFMSGYTANVIAHHGVLDADVHFLQKPFSSRELALRVQEALQVPT